MFNVSILRLTVVELYYKKAKGKSGGHLNLRCLPASPRDKLKFEKRRETFPWSLIPSLRHWRIWYPTVSWVEAVGIQPVPGHICQCPHAQHYFFLFFILKQLHFISTHTWEPRLSRQECWRPRWDTEAIQKKSSSQKDECWHDTKASPNAPVWAPRASESRNHRIKQIGRDP